MEEPFAGRETIIQVRQNAPHQHSGSHARVLAKNVDMGGCLEYRARVLSKCRFYEAMRSQRVLL